MRTVQLCVNGEGWDLALPDSELPVPRPSLAEVIDPNEAIREAVEHPIGFVPLGKAVIPEDRVAIAVDPSLPRLGELLSGLWQSLAAAGVRDEDVTLITAPGGRADWWEDLPEELEELHVEDHVPGTQERLSFLANTESGQRVYLNRALVDADFVVVLAPVRYDPFLGVIGGADALYPTFADNEARERFLDGSIPEPNQLAEFRQETQEVARMLGIPLFVHIIEGSSGDILDVTAGLADSEIGLSERYRARWGMSLNQSVRTVLATSSGGGFEQLSRALACASRAVAPGGRIVLFSPAHTDMTESSAVIRESATPAAAVERLARERPKGWRDAIGWAAASSRARLFLAGAFPEELAEQMFATHLIDQSAAQLLIDEGGDVVLLPDADKTWLHTET